MKTISPTMLFILAAAREASVEGRLETAKAYAGSGELCQLCADQLIQIDHVTTMGTMPRPIVKLLPRGFVLLDAMMALPLPEECIGWRMPSE